MSYTIAWVVVAGAAVIGSLALYMLTRGVRSSVFRWLLRVLPPVLMLVPAPVPGFPVHFAPAFVVFIFESIFQSNGRPTVALLLLSATGLAATLITVLLARSKRVAATAADGEAN